MSDTLVFLTVVLLFSEAISNLLLSCLHHQMECTKQTMRRTLS